MYINAYASTYGRTYGCAACVHIYIYIYIYIFIYICIYFNNSYNIISIFLLEAMSLKKPGFSDKIPKNVQIHAFDPACPTILLGNTVKQSTGWVCEK